MPYIPQSERTQFDNSCVGLGCGARSKGQLTYVFYRIALEYLRPKSKTYQNISDVKAALHDAMMEWQRQVLDKHEDTKIIENGAIE